MPSPAKGINGASDCPTQDASAIAAEFAIAEVVDKTMLGSLLGTARCWTWACATLTLACGPRAEVAPSAVPASRTSRRLGGATTLLVLRRVAHTWPPWTNRKLKNDEQIAKSRL
jgi:hypothetical protein